MMLTGYTPGQELQDRDAEKGVLGSILIDPEAMARVKRTDLKPEHFYSIKHQVIYKTMLSIHEEDMEITLKTLVAWLMCTGEDKKVGVLYLVNLSGDTVSSASDQFHACNVRNRAELRQIIDENREMIRQARRPGAQAHELKRGEA